MKRVLRQYGLSLIELMIAMTLGLMITITLGYIFVGSRGTYRSQDANARVQDTGRFVMDFIGRQIQTAGRSEITPVVSDGTTGFDGVALTGINAEREISYPKSGGAVGKRGVDELRVRYQLSDMGGAGIQDCNGDSNGDDDLDGMNIGGVAVVGLDESKTPIPGSGGKAVGLIVNVFELRRNEKRTVSGRALGELFCWGNGGGGAQPIAEGIEDLQFRYGLDRDGDSSVDAVDGWLEDSPDATEENQIVAVEVCILVHSLETGAVTSAQRVTDCSGTTYTAADTLLYRTFRQVFSLRNRINVTP